MNRKYYPAASMFVGETTWGVPAPIFYDTHTAIGNGKTPVTLITGASGSGKTTAGQLIAANQAIMGKTTVVFDYKGDMAKLGFLADSFGVDLRIWNLGATNRKTSELTHSGVLDPMLLSRDPRKKMELTMNLIQILIGNELGRSDRNAIQPVIADVIESGSPTLTKVVAKLRGESNNERARIVGAELHGIRSINYGSLIFSSGREAKVPPKIADGGMTIITLSGMKLPESKSETENTPSGRLINGILYLLTDYIRAILADDESTRPKTMIVDEAWAFLNTDAGKSVFRAVALMGRSKRLALILITQSPLHIADSDIRAQISTRFAFQAKEEKEQKAHLSAMGLEEEGFSEVLKNLEPHTCLYSDWKGDYAVMRFIGWKKEWMDILTTNPEQLAEIRRKKQALKRELERQRENE